MVEIIFPVEFIVKGTPVSSQTKRRASIEQWKKLVKEAGTTALPEGHFFADGRFSITLFYFPADKMQGDIDNIVKPILDALCKYVYSDDALVERVLVQKFEPGAVFQFGDPTSVLAEALKQKGPILFVRVSSNPFEDLR